MIFMQITDKNSGIVVEKSFFDHNQMYDAKNTAIRLAGYAGYFKFEKNRSGDLVADNETFKVDIVRV